MFAAATVFEVPEVDLPEVAWWLPALIAVVGAVGLAGRWLPARRVDLGGTRWFAALVRLRVFPLGLQWVVLLAFLAVLAVLQLPRAEVSALPPGLALAWGVWWNLFLVSLVFAGRLWCSVCPIFFLSQSLPHFGRRLAPWGSLALAGALYLGLGAAIVLTGAEADPVSTTWLLGGLVVLGVLVNAFGPGLAFCRSVCPALVFARIFGRYSFVGAGRRARQLSCTLVGGPIPLSEAEELPPSDCSLCLKCNRVQPVVSLPRRRPAPVEKGWIATVVFASAWSGVALEVAATRTFWAELTLFAERAIPTTPLAVGAMVLGLALLLSLGARVFAGPRYPALWDALSPLLLCAMLYLVLFSASHHLPWAAHHLGHLLGGEGAALRMREAVLVPPLWNAETLRPVGATLAGVGTVHALVGVFARARAGALPWRALAWALLLGAGWAFLLSFPFVEAC